eukprot:9497338-Karenia_brevis.AAC.1
MPSESLQQSLGLGTLMPGVPVPIGLSRTLDGQYSTTSYHLRRVIPYDDDDDDDDDDNSDDDDD